jgi:hypothetical protein
LQEPVLQGRQGRPLAHRGLEESHQPEGGTRQDRFARLTFGKPDLLMEVLGVEPGSVTPFGLINDRDVRTNVILDERMMAEEKLNFHPLQNAATTTIAAADLISFIRSCGHDPRIVAVSDPLP